MSDFANILFGGPCNRFCPFCIGQQLPARLRLANLDTYPLRNQDGFVEEVKRLDIRQIVLTGTSTDPLLYRHQVRLLEALRERLPQRTFSLHSNGARALQQMEIFNRYDKACLSIPSFHPATYQAMMGSTRIPDLARILERSRIEVKVSCLLNEHNIGELDDFLGQCQRLGVTRVVLRRLYGETQQGGARGGERLYSVPEGCGGRSTQSPPSTRDWNVLPGQRVARWYRGNPVYDVDGMEVTYWNFDTTQSTSINLYADGTLSSSYLLGR